MTSNFAEVDFKTQQGMKGIDYTVPGKLVLVGKRLVKYFLLDSILLPMRNYTSS
jgi:hypothetical protein